MSVLDTDLITRKTASEMVGAYQEAAKIINQAYDDLARAKKMLAQAFGNDYGFDTLPNSRGYFYSTSPAPEVLSLIRQNAWRCIIDRIEIRKTLSVKRAEEMDKMLSDPKNIPEITDAAVYDMVQTLVQQSSDFAHEAVMEVFEYLRPAAKQQYYRRQYKTNQKNGKYSIGKRVIIPYVIGDWLGASLQVKYNCEDELRAVDKIFYLLDGAGTPPGYRGELIDAINTSGGVGETKYFRFRACQNGNLHLEFKRLDLVDHLNAIAGNPTQLRGE